MARVNLPELADQPWWPAWARDGMTGYLHEIIKRARPYSLAVPHLARLLRESGTIHIIDLCSGAGGPWPSLRQDLEAAGVAVEVLCTDLSPNRAAAHRLDHAEGVRYHVVPVSATSVPPELKGARTMFSALHHFSDADIREILARAQEDRAPFAAFEATSRSWRGLLATLVIPFAVLILMPLVRPLDWRALWLTYLPPVMPLAIWWDGLISTLRTARVEELRALIAALPQTREPYRWVVEEIDGGPVPILALCGSPSIK